MTAQQIINDVAHYYGITPGQFIHGDKHRIYAVNKVGDWMRLQQLNPGAAAFVSKLTDKKTPCD